MQWAGKRNFYCKELLNMPTTKGRPATKGGSRSRSTTAKKGAANTAAQRQLFAVVTFALGLLFIALSFVEGDNVWLWLHEFTLGIFSWCSYLVGPILIYIAIMATMDRPGVSLKARGFFAVLFIVLLCGFVQLFSGGGPKEATFMEICTYLYENGKALAGGGLAAGLIGVPLYSWFGFWGALITMLLVMFVLAMALSGTTLLGLFQTAARPMRKLEEAYTDGHDRARAARQNQAAETPERTPRFDIDVALDDDTNGGKRSGGKAIVPAAAAPTVDAREQMLNAAAGYAAGQEANSVAAAKGKKTTVITPDDLAGHAQPPGPNPIDEIVTRAVSGVTTIPEGNPSTVTRSGKFNFGAKGAAETAAPAEAATAPVAAEATPLPEPVYTFPPINLLDEGMIFSPENVEEELKYNAARLVDTLKSFGVQTRIVDISRGPAVTRYELQPSAGVKISKITGLADDIALNLAAAGVRIEAPIPNKAAVGIEVPNKHVNIVTIREVIHSEKFEKAPGALTVALGKDIAGSLTVADLGRMPHMLIAGATGSGKSVCINSIIISLLYKSSPDKVKLLMVDPKVVELGGYNGIPHLMMPVVTDPKKAAGALCWAVGEMTRRYKTFADTGVRDLAAYNVLCEEREELTPLPQIVIIIDELADLMMVAPNDVEDYICRLAQMARAAGMHLVIATQRPSVDVITGIIKANIPSRVAFAVSSQVDSRTILDMGGAEKLLGRGDMLFYPVGNAKPVRVQGCFVADKEVERVVAFVKEGAAQHYDDQMIQEIDQMSANIGRGKNGGGRSSDMGSSDGGEDEMLDAAIEAVVEAGLASTSLLQRRLKLGYARAARIIDDMEQRGIVGPFEGSKPRQVLISKERWYEMKLNRED